MANIALITELFAPSVGGQEIRFQSIADHLVRRGHDVSIFCIGHEVGLAEEEVLPFGARVFRYPVDADYKRRSSLGMRRSIRSILKFSLRLRAELSRRPFDAIFANQWPLAHALLLPARVRRKMTLDWCETRNGLFYRMAQRHLPRRAYRNTGVSSAVAQDIEAQSGRPADVVESGIDLDDYRCSPRTSRAGLLYFGRLSPHKNVDQLLAAFDLLKAEGYPGALSIGGSGPDADRLKALAASSPYRDEIHFLGFVTDERKVDLLANSELLIIPSKREGFPRVIAEAYASGLPVVTTDYPENGSVAVLREFGGGVVAGRSAESLAALIREALDDWTMLSEQGLRAAPQLSWSFLITKLEAALLKSATCGEPQLAGSRVEALQ